MFQRVNTMRTTSRTDAARVLGLFLAAYLAYAALMWLPELVDFDISRFGLVAYTSLTILPILIVLGLYVFAYRRADEFFQHLTLVATSVAFLLSGCLGLIFLTFSRFGMPPPQGASIFNVLVISWLLSYSYFLWRSR